MSGVAGLKWMVVIPAYNEETTIKALIKAVLLQQPDQLLVVNDASTDQSAELLNSLKNEFNFQVVHQSKNKGKAACLWVGFDQAMRENMDLIITLDGDGQHRAEDIPALLHEYQQQPSKLVIGARERNLKTQPIGRFIANRFANFWISWAAGYGVSDSQSGFRLYPITLLKKIIRIRYSEGFVFESEVIIEAAWQGHYTTVITIPSIYHKNRRASHFKPWHDIKKITKMVACRLKITHFSLIDLYAAITNRPAPE
jgi:glycosyltransferase involved in cell wall biosynthesis